MIRMSNVIYEPAEDSELLLEVALREVKAEDEVIEVGGGSGFVSERIKEKCRFLIATDISPFAVKEMKKKGIETVRTDIAAGIKKRFTLVLFNPPYLELENELKTGTWIDVAVDGGKRGIEVLSKFLDSLNDIMADNGRAIVIVSSQNEPDVFMEIMRRGYRYRIIGERKLFFEKLYALRITY
jgi:release factor glutamine methyltransferase